MACDERAATAADYRRHLRPELARFVRDYALFVSVPEIAARAARSLLSRADWLTNLLAEALDKKRAGNLRWTPTLEMQQYIDAQLPALVAKIERAAVAHV